MHEKDELCRKIKEVHPDIGECGIDVNLNWNDDKKAWVVELRKGKEKLTTHLEPEDAKGCMAGKQCISLGLQIAQLKKNIGA